MLPEIVILIFILSIMGLATVGLTVILERLLK